MSDAEQILRTIVDDDPLTYNVNDGMDDGCWFCDADVEYREVSKIGVTHWADCTWVAGRRLFGMPLLDHHDVSAEARPE